MSRELVVYVRRILNLSEARYCAGMGVDLLGFVVDPSDDHFVNEVTYREIMGWVSGPRPVFEIGKGRPDGREYEPEFYHVSGETDPSRVLAGPKLIVELPPGLLHASELIKTWEKSAAYFLVPTPADFEKVSAATRVPVLVSVRDQGQFREIRKLKPAGIALEGSAETVAGLKDYEHLSTILEELEG